MPFPMLSSASSSRSCSASSSPSCSMSCSILSASTSPSFLMSSIVPYGILFLCHLPVSQSMRHRPQPVAEARSEALLSPLPLFHTVRCTPIPGGHAPLLLVADLADLRPFALSVSCRSHQYGMTVDVSKQNDFWKNTLQHPELAGLLAIVELIDFVHEERLPNISLIGFGMTRRGYVQLPLPAS